MRKSLLKIALLALATAGVASGLQSCKDYDPEIENLQNQINGITGSDIAGLQSQINAAASAASSAQTTANSASAAAANALEIAQQAAANGVTNAQLQAVEQAMQQFATQAAAQAKADALNAIADSMKAVAADIAAAGKTAEDAIQATKDNAAAIADLEAALEQLAPGAAIDTEQLVALIDSAIAANSLTDQVEGLSADMQQALKDIDSLSSLTTAMQTQLAALEGYEDLLAELAAADVVANLDSAKADIAANKAAIAANSALITGLLADVQTNAADIADLKAKFETIAQDVAEEIGPQILTSAYTVLAGRPTSITQQPEVFINGIPAISFYQISYQPYTTPTSGTTKGTYTAPTYDVKKVVTIGSGTSTVVYNVQPSNWTIDAIDTPEYQSFVAISRANDNPVLTVDSYTQNANGQLEVVAAIDQEVYAALLEDADSKAAAFVYLSAPVTEEYLYTDVEESAFVTSGYSVLDVQQVVNLSNIGTDVISLVNVNGTGTTSDVIATTAPANASAITKPLALVNIGESVNLADYIKPIVGTDTVSATDLANMNLYVAFNLVTSTLTSSNPFEGSADAEITEAGVLTASEDAAAGDVATVAVTLRAESTTGPVIYAAYFNVKYVIEQLDAVVEAPTQEIALFGQDGSEELEGLFPIDWLIDNVFSLVGAKTYNQFTATGKFDQTPSITIKYPTGLKTNNNALFSSVATSVTDYLVELSETDFNTTQLPQVIKAGVDTLSYVATIVYESADYGKVTLVDTIKVTVPQTVEFNKVGSFWSAAPVAAPNGFSYYTYTVEPTKPLSNNDQVAYSADILEGFTAPFVSGLETFSTWELGVENGYFVGHGANAKKDANVIAQGSNWSLTPTSDGSVTSTLTAGNAGYKNAAGKTPDILTALNFSLAVPTAAPGATSSFTSGVLVDSLGVVPVFLKVNLTGASDQTAYKADSVALNFVAPLEIVAQNTASLPTVTDNLAANDTISLLNAFAINNSYGTAVYNGAAGFNTVSGVLLGKFYSIGSAAYTPNQTPTVNDIFDLGSIAYTTDQAGKTKYTGSTAEMNVTVTTVAADASGAQAASKYKGQTVIVYTHTDGTLVNAPVYVTIPVTVKHLWGELESQVQFVINPAN